METTATFSISEVGESGRNYIGTFIVKTSLTRHERFVADQIRREIIGPSPEGSTVPADLQFEAHMLGQLRVRIVKAPEWWTDSAHGLELEDANIITKLFGYVIKEEAKKRSELKKEAKQALEQLAKSTDE